MDDKVKRYLEISTRKQYLMESKTKLDEELNNDTMLFLAKALDGDIENKAKASIAIINRWIQEMDNELQELQEYINENYYKKVVIDYVNVLKSKAKVKAEEIINNDKKEVK